MMSGKEAERLMAEDRRRAKIYTKRGYGLRWCPDCGCEEHAVARTKCLKLFKKADP